MNVYGREQNIQWSSWSKWHNAPSNSPNAGTLNLADCGEGRSLNVGSLNSIRGILYTLRDSALYRFFIVRFRIYIRCYSQQIAATGTTTLRKVATCDHNVLCLMSICCYSPLRDGLLSPHDSPFPLPHIPSNHVLQLQLLFLPQKYRHPLAHPEPVLSSILRRCHLLKYCALVLSSMSDILRWPLSLSHNAQSHLAEESTRLEWCPFTSFSGTVKIKRRQSSYLGCQA